MSRQRHLNPNPDFVMMAFGIAIGTVIYRTIQYWGWVP